MAAANKKPKSTKGVRSTRASGKKPKQNPKSNPVATGRTTNGYTLDAIERRSEIRNVSFRGLTG